MSAAWVFCLYCILQDEGKLTPPQKLHSLLPQSFVVSHTHVTLMTVVFFLNIGIPLILKLILAYSLKADALCFKLVARVFP